MSGHTIADRHSVVLADHRPAETLSSRNVAIAPAASVAICVAVVAGYFAYVARYAANGVFRDDWNLVDILRRSQAGTLTLGDLWLQHNQSRIFFPNIIAMLLGNATGFSDTAFIYLGAILLVAAVLLLIVACRKELFAHPLIYLPAIFVFFSLAQYENTLWAFQFAWFLVAACICGVLLLLTAPQVSAWRLILAIALGVVASYSLLQGLEIWPAGLLALLRPGTSTRVRATWCVTSVIVTALYVPGLNFSSMGGPPLSEFPSHLPTATLGLLVAIGSVMPNVLLVTGSGAQYSATMAFGALVSIAGAIVVVSWWIHGRHDRVLSIAACLVVVGFLFDLLLMPARLSEGLINGTPSRYTTFNLLLLAGAYTGAVRTLLMTIERGGPRRIAISGALVGLTAALVCIQVPTATRAGEDGGISTHAAHEEAANLTANYDGAPPTLVATYVYPPSYEYFRSLAAYLEIRHLNVFGDGESATYRRTGVLAGGVVTSPLPVPPEFGDIRADPTEWRAWLALSSVYEQRPDLQTAFSGASAQVSREMDAWAVRSGIDASEPIYSPVLMPYAEQYKQWMADEK
jgi:hypothetical protein